MKILMISTDRGIFDKNSEVRQRMVDYGKLTDELHIIVFAKRTSGKTFDFAVADSNVFLYSTGSVSRWLYIFDAVKIAGKIIKNARNDILITTQDPFETGLVGWFTARKFKIPFQLQIHTDFLSPYFKKGSLLNRVRVLIAKFLILRASCVRVVSARIVNSLSGSAKTTLPIFVDIERIKNTPAKINLREKYPQFDFLILMASRLEKEKNIALAIPAFSEVVKKYPKTGMIIVGDGAEKENLKNLTQKSELNGSIIFEDWQKDLISYYKTADLFLLSSNYEGYGMTLVEAAASGQKIISSNVGVAGDILEEENIFEPGNQKELEEKIINAISGNIKPAKMIQSQTKEEYLREYKKAWQECV